MVNLVGLEVRLLVSCCHRQAGRQSGGGGGEQNEFGLPTGTKFGMTEESLASRCVAWQLTLKLMAAALMVK